MLRLVDFIIEYYKLKLRYSVCKFRNGNFYYYYYVLPHLNESRVTGSMKWVQEKSFIESQSNETKRKGNCVMLPSNA